jgi:hypothetical protein
MYALLALFLGEGTVKRIPKLLPWQGERGGLRILRLFILGYAGLVAASFLPIHDGHMIYYAGRQLLWMVFATFIIIIGWGTLMRIAEDAPAPVIRSVGILWIVPVLVFLNGIAPILGLKTRSSWQMYSNIWIDASGSNHFLIPQSLDLWGILGDEVTIEGTSDPYLRETYLVPGQKLTFFDLKAYTASHPDISLTFKRKGIMYSFARVGDEKELATPPSWWARKLYYFRPLGAQVADECQW